MKETFWSKLRELWAIRRRCQQIKLEQRQNRLPRSNESYGGTQRLAKIVLLKNLLWKQDQSGFFARSSFARVHSLRLACFWPAHWVWDCWESSFDLLKATRTKRVFTLGYAWETDGPVLAAVGAGWPIYQPVGFHHRRRADEWGWLPHINHF